MSSNIDNLSSKIHALKEKLKIEFRRHKQNIQKFCIFLKKASLKNILSAPVIWAVVIPTALLDIGVSLFQAICFPIYGIPKVNRNDYIVFDRRHLSYLNFIEKINCIYCSYFNGCIAYIQEVAARTEQYWCPIKHARKTSTLHSRYQHFLEYGDAESYLQNKEQARRKFYDLKQVD